ncbi:hypothetical protein K1X76_12405, partial [bacterium]|nr:hypothetical protein [bacterium]
MLVCKAEGFGEELCTIFRFFREPWRGTGGPVAQQSWAGSKSRDAEQKRSGAGFASERVMHAFVFKRAVYSQKNLNQFSFTLSNFVFEFS